MLRVRVISRRARPAKLTRSDSAAFALAAERAELEPAYRIRGLGLDFEGEKPNSHFYTWAVVPSWGQGSTHFAVDHRTGDVWAYLGCKRVQSRELAFLQAKFRHRAKLPPADVAMIRREGFPDPDC